MMIDNHIHTNYSKDAEGTVLDLLEPIQRLGLRQISVTNHSPLARQFPKKWIGSIDPDEICAYKRDVESLREKAGGCIVNFGIEVDYVEGEEEWIRKFVERFDFSLGSIHIVPGFFYDFTENGFSSCDIKGAVCEYYRLVRSACQMKVFDVISHLDYIKKYNRDNKYFDPKSVWYQEEVGKTLRQMKANDCVMMVNTSGISHYIGKQFPSEVILREALKMGIPISIGSDAHLTDEVCQDYDSVLKIFKEIGFREIVMFDRHKRIPVPLG